jgi:hypothetical protein
MISDTFQHLAQMAAVGHRTACRVLPRSIRSWRCLSIKRGNPTSLDAFYQAQSAMTLGPLNKRLSVIGPLRKY